jgi:hydrophobe/amphiphile efflux-1 (HAE1) family protein
MMNLALILFGLIGLSRLPVRELPDVDPPVVNILTVYPGASAAVVETEITEKLEEVINTIEGIKTVTSESREQVSNISVEFSLAREIDLAAQDVRDRVARIRGRLPDEIDEPVIAKQDGDARPFMWVALFSDEFSSMDLSDLAENNIKDPLQTVRGVSSVILGGNRRYAMRLWLDSKKMAARGVTVLDVQSALRRQNIELPSGIVENRQREMAIQTMGELKTVEEFNRLVIREEGANPVRLADVGRAAIGVEDERTVARYTSKPSIGLGIIRQSKANTIEVARGIKEEMQRLAPLLPAGVEYFVAYDESVYVERAIREVWITLGVAFLLVIVTIFIFLRNVRSTLIPVISIPVAVVSTFAVLSLLGFSINIVTMMALVLTIGVVVDDSIVVLENIYRHIEEGMEPIEAAIQGMKEIVFAVIATTLALVAVFLPMAMLTSLTGRLFIEFAITLAGSVIISSFVALSLTPMAASRLLRPIAEEDHGRMFIFFERQLNRVSDGYERTLRFSLRHRLAVVLIGLSTVGISYLFFQDLEKGFLPDEDKGSLLCLAFAPEGATSEYTDRMVKQMEAIVASVPEVDGYFSAVAIPFSGPGKSSFGVMFVKFKDDRDRSVQDIVNGPMGLGARFFGDVEGAFAIANIPKAISGGFQQPFQVALQHPDLAKLNEVTEEISNRLRAEGFLANVRPDFELAKPELLVNIDRDRAATLGVSIEEVSQTLQILFGGQDLSKVKRDGKEYDVIVRLDRESRLTPNDVERLYVRNSANLLTQLSNVVSLEPAGGPSSIFHYNRYRSATISGSPAGVPLGTAMEKTTAILDEMLPPDFRYEWRGQTKDLLDTGRDIYFIVGVALIVVFMVLASQFESLVHPFTVMMTIPLASVGAFGGLWLLNEVNGVGTMLFEWGNYAPDAPDWVKTASRFVPRIPAMNINLFSQIGLVLLIALSTKNAILLVEFSNQQMLKGKSALEAVVSAGRIRLRPILMTSFSTVAGIMPIAIGFGAGAESRRPLGVVAVGGLTTSTVLTLFLIPVVYTLFDDLKTWCAAKRRGLEAIEAVPE